MTAPTSPEPVDSATARSRRTRRWLRHPAVQALFLLLVLVLVQNFLVKLYAVPSASMAPTLAVGERILVNRLAYLSDAPQTGDIVVFDGDEDWRPARDEPGWKSAAKQVSEVVGIGPGRGDSLVKRIIAGPGQRVTCCGLNGVVVVDGVPLDEDYLGSNPDFTPGVLDCGTTPTSARCFPEFVVPEDQFVVLGDNRAASRDSVAQCRGQTTDAGQCLLTVHRDDIVGELLLVVWPPGRARLG
ncbi:signal peptidase I [Tessaracoccus defluvii]|uniref:Signal peptidase I n=1 Tax=Tessaracoccus defluvii TaxID=1285901 RepID=A0A7H0H3C8_9ACTN|nr:signal peptidase I [Tessaracoccus defluvii]QNP55044.1 signal peptidase I [Tessaracoccus defluvii]